jgi:hypothetical protein
MIMGEGPEASAEFTAAVAATELAWWRLVRWPADGNAELFGLP